MPDRQITTELVKKGDLSIRVTLYYWVEKRSNPGFYLSAVPVTHSNDGFETCTLSQIRSVQVATCNRFSSKAKLEALALVPEKQTELISKIIAEQAASKS